jgi:hypothetical protein
VIDVKYEVLEQWEKAAAAAAAAKLVIEKEQELRKQVASLFFTEPKEGVNGLDLEKGWELKLTYKVDRKIDEASLSAVKEQLTEMGISIDTLLQYKPSLAASAYKSLVAVNPLAGKIFDQALIIKPASPTLELVPPKEIAQ